MTSKSEALKLKNQVAPALLQDPDVASIGVGWDPQEGYVVAVDLVTGHDRAKLPCEVAGHKIRYEVSGALEPFLKASAC